MHNAPPAAYPVGRFVWGFVLFVCILAVSAAGLFNWQIQSQPSGAVMWSAWVFWAACAAATAYGGPKQTLSEGHLLWSGEAWLWRSGLGEADLPDEEQVLNLTVGLDLGSSMLLLLRTTHATQLGGGPLYGAWVSAQVMPSKWHGFRCAVYSRPKAIKQSADSAL